MTINSLNIKNRPAVITTRFAPSPTGYMHIGNLRTALFSYLYAKSKEGRFLLRIEDTDQERSKPEYLVALLKDFEELGISWDEEIVYQSKRMQIYEKFYQILLEKGLMYRCFCSEEKLSLARKVQLSQGLPPRYAGTCLKLSPEDLKRKLDDHEPACWRFKVPKNVVVEFEDLIKGKQTFNSNDFGDFVIRRQDGASPFMFCSVIDDVLQGVTDVLRGEDHVSNTPRQLLILQALDLDPPNYGHFSLLSNNNENDPKLSKRTGSQSIRDFLGQGYLPTAILNYLARLGNSYSNQENHLLNLKELSLNFDLTHVSSHPAKHDLVHLKFWQKQAMLAISNQELLKVLQQISEFNSWSAIFSADELQAFLSFIKPNILMPKEAIDWCQILFTNNLQELNYYKELSNYLKNISLIFLQSIVTCEDLESLVKKLKSLGFSNKEIFMNLRIILTGKDFGPELAKIFEIMGIDRIKNRVNQIIKLLST